MQRIDRRGFLRICGAGAVSLGLPIHSREWGRNGRPNVVIVFVDDMGYGDMTPTGHPTIVTPNLDRMADEGVLMTQFYSAASVCSPSRAALLTGRYPIRNGMVRVVFPADEQGLPENEITIAEALKTEGYATACIGKWHLGHRLHHLPTRHGFDTYFGIPYSNDMDFAPRGEPPIPLMRGEAVIEQPCVQDTLTKRYTEEAVRFIEEHRKRPFFLYLAHTMPHIPLHASEEFRGSSKRGLYGDVIQEIDWSVGEILEALRRTKLDRKTLVVFSSDNGPWKRMRERGGSAGPFRGGKITTWEGGVREPFIARFPGVIPANTVSTEIGTTMDLFTTCLTLAGAEIPKDRPIDGKDLIPVLQGRQKSRHEAIFCYYDDELTAVRAGKYKLHLKTFRAEGRFDTADPPELYDVETDPSEETNIQEKHPEVVRRIREMAERHGREVRERNENAELIDSLLAWKRKKGSG